MKLKHHCDECVMKDLCITYTNLKALFDTIEHSYTRIPYNRSEWATATVLHFGDGSDGLIFELDCKKFTNIVSKEES